MEHPEQRLAGAADAQNRQHYVLLEAKLEPMHSSPSASPSAGQRLLAALPAGAFVNKPQEIDRFLVRVWPDGTLYFKGSRERVEEFLRLCTAAGIRVHVDHISLCG